MFTHQLQSLDSPRHTRFPYRGAVRRKGQSEDNLQAVDLSAGGIGVLSAERLGLGRVVEILLLHHNVRVQGVIRSEVAEPESHWRIGIEFLDPQPDLLAIAMTLQKALN